MNKKLDASATEYALDKISVKCPACGMDSLWNNHSNDFKAGAEWALREAIKICNKKLEQNFQYIKSKGDYVDPNTFNLIQEVRRFSIALQFIVKELEQLLSNKGENNGKL